MDVSGAEASVSACVSDSSASSAESGFLSFLSFFRLCSVAEAVSSVCSASLATGTGFSFTGAMGAGFSSAEDLLTVLVSSVFDRGAAGSVFLVTLVLVDEDAVPDFLELLDLVELLRSTGWPFGPSTQISFGWVGVAAGASASGRNCSTAPRFSSIVGCIGGAPASAARTSLAARVVQSARNRQATRIRLCFINIRKRCGAAILSQSGESVISAR